MTHQNKLTIKKLGISFVEAVTGKQTNFTEGSIRKAIFMLSIPMILEMLMESIFALVDIAYVSQVSVNAVATIGLTESVITLVYAVAIGLSMAATAIVARRIGEKDVPGAQKAAVQAILLGIVIALLVGTIGFLFSKEILGLMGAEHDLIEEGHGYTQLLIGGNITILLLFLINAIFRGAGNASVAMWTLVLSNGLYYFRPHIYFWLGTYTGVWCCWSGNCHQHRTRYCGIISARHIMLWLEYHKNKGERYTDRCKNNEQSH